MDEKELHPLEIIALQELPWDVMVKRVASLALRERFGYLPVSPTSRDITKIVNKLNEPRGKKGRLRKELKSEISRQRRIRNERRKHHRRLTLCMVKGDATNMIGVSDWDVERRRAIIVLKRIGKSYKPLDRKVIWNINRIPSFNVVDTKLSRCEAFALARPSRVWIGHCYSFNEEQHKVRYLLFNVGGVGGNARVPVTCKTVDEAVQSLKRTSVLTAEKKSYAVTIDWANRCFRVKSPRRKSWREIPFKESKKTQKRRR